jgi:hypothetical protein
MTLIWTGTGAATCRCNGMENLSTPHTLRQLAEKMRRQAGETTQPDYQGMMNRVAESLDAEADIVAARLWQELAHGLNSTPVLH